MRRKLDELYAIAVANGYTGAKPTTIIGALDALTDSLAGENIDSGTTVSEAVRAIAPYIGSGSGGGGGVQYGTSYAAIGCAPNTAGSDGFVPDMSQAVQPAGYVVDASSQMMMPLSESMSGSTNNDVFFLDGTTAVVHCAVPSGKSPVYPDEPGPVEAVISYDMFAENIEWEPYNGVEYLGDGKFVVPVRGIPDGDPGQTIIAFRLEMEDYTPSQPS